MPMFVESDGSLRVLLQHENLFGAFLDDRQRAIEGLSLEKLDDLISWATWDRADDYEISPKLIHVFAPAPNVRDSQESSVRYASPRVTTLLLEALAKKPRDLTPLVESMERSDKAGNLRIAI